MHVTKKFSNQHFISLKLIGFNKQNRAKFKSILSIAEFRLDIPWQIVDSTDADFYLLFSQVRSQTDRNTILRSLPEEKRIFCTHDSINNNELLLSGDNIPSLASLVLLFNQLTKTKLSPISQENSSTSPLTQQPTKIDYSSFFSSRKPSGTLKKSTLKIKTNRLTKTRTTPSSQINGHTFTYPDQQPTKVDYSSTFSSRKSSETLEKNTSQVETNCLTKTEAAPISQVNNSTPLTQKLAGVDCLSTFSSRKSSETIEKTTLEIETNFFDPKLGILGKLLSNEDDFKFFNLTNTSGANKLYINVKDRTYYCINKLENLDGVFSSVAPLIPHSLTENELRQVIINEELKSQPLDNLIWHVTFNCSQGKIIKGYAPSDIVHLKRWPDITLPGCRSLIKLAAYMQSNAANLETAQQKTGFSSEQINNFYNACKVIGLIVQANQTDIHDKNLNNEKLQLFAQIGKRLNQKPS